MERTRVLIRRHFILRGALALSAAGPWGLWAHAQPAGARSPVILVVGDSLSAEYGLKRGEGWVALMEKRLAEQKIPARVVNASISGDTTSGGRARLPALLAQHRPTHVILELGANDALRGLPLKTSQDNLQAMINLARQQKAKVLLVGMQIPPNYGPDYTRRFAGMFQELAKSNKVALVPFFFEGIAADLSLFQADHIHPNEQAQPRLLDNVWPYLKPLVGVK